MDERLIIYELITDTRLFFLLTIYCQFIIWRFYSKYHIILTLSMVYEADATVNQRFRVHFPIIPYTKYSGTIYSSTRETDQTTKTKY